MNKVRLNKIIDLMKKNIIPQMIITDPVAIFYLIGKWIYPGERLLALYIEESGKTKLILNELFPQEDDLGIEIVWYKDTDDGVMILSKVLENHSIMGIDKMWPAHFLLRLQEIHREYKYVNSSKIIDEVRMIKDEEEQKIMIESSKINDEVIAELIPYVVKGYSENEMAEIVKKIYKKHGVERLSFQPIIAYEKNGADPHHGTDDSKGKKGDSVVLDIGGFYKDYASDMTRTVFIGEVSERQREVYEVVKEANRRGIEASKPGNRMCDVDLACRNYIEEMGFGKYFTHRTGHSIGLEDHEFGDVSSVNEAIIRPGQCFSVEPGIYLKEEGIGVRIEDLVLITEDGCKVLNNYTKDLIVVKEESNND